MNRYRQWGLRRKAKLNRTQRKRTPDEVKAAKKKRAKALKIRDWHRARQADG